MQVIALGDGKFHAVGYPGGLPGDGWDGDKKLEADGELKDGVVAFPGERARGEIKDGVLRVLSADNDVLGRVEKGRAQKPHARAPSRRQARSCCSTARAPTSFEPGKMTDDGLLDRRRHQQAKVPKLPVARRVSLPFMPTARGQGRGNSGCYLQGRYEVQMLDSFGLEGENNECGGIYEHQGART